MAEQQVDVNIVIPNYNGLCFLSDCLKSIEQQQYHGWQVTVVDNGSSDGSIEYMRESHPEMRCISLPENRGFSAAVNAGILSSSVPYIFLLNNDTELTPDCLQQMVTAAAEQDEFDFFAPKMLSFDEREILDGAGDGYLRGGAGYRLGTMEKDSEVYNQPGAIFGACGGAVLYRRALFDTIGMFDEDFFAYLEDVDLNLRMNRAGLRGYYVPAARVYHIGSATSGSKINEFVVKLSTRNSIYVLLKNYPLSLFIRFLPVILFYQFCWFLWVVKKRQFAAYCRGMWLAITSFRQMRSKHHQFSDNDQLSVSAFASCLKRAERDVVDSIMRRRSGEGKGNSILRIYGTLFL